MKSYHLKKRTETNTHTKTDKWCSSARVETQECTYHFFKIIEIYKLIPFVPWFSVKGVFANTISIFHILLNYSAGHFSGPLEYFCALTFMGLCENNVEIVASFKTFFFPNADDLRGNSVIAKAERWTCEQRKRYANTQRNSDNICMKNWFPSFQCIIELTQRNL